MAVISDHSHIAWNEHSTGILFGIPTSQRSCRATLQISQRIEVIPTYSARSVDPEVAIFITELPVLFHLSEINDLMNHDGLTTGKSDCFRIEISIRSSPGVIEFTWNRVKCIGKDLIKKRQRETILFLLPSRENHQRPQILFERSSITGMLPNHLFNRIIEITVRLQECIPDFLDMMSSTVLPYHDTNKPV